MTRAVRVTVALAVALALGSAIAAQDESSDSAVSGLTSKGTLALSVGGSDGESSKRVGVGVQPEGSATGSAAPPT
jgi:hypothetical protein